jgi:DNA-binding response OmpR family regulator
VRSYRDALDSLNRDHMAVIICDSSLAGGNWKDILSHTQILPDPPCVIVTALLPDDRLWAEVLNLGGYDLLAKPFVREEVVRLAELASTSWRRAAEIRVHVTASQ